MSEYSYEAPGVVVESIGGCCPVQAEGTVDGHGFYFRARGGQWSMEIADVWECQSAYGASSDAGHMSPEHVRKCLDAAFAAYRAMPRGPQ